MRHPAIVRLCHWVFALAVTVAIGSGLEVFAAFPGFGEKVTPMARHYLLFGPKPTVTETYNPLQKMADSVALLLIVVSIVTGFALYKPVHLSWLVDVLGGFRLTRVWHFAAMCGLLAFIPGHLVMVALHGWSNVASMWTGSKP